jgi:hypothetical protein
LLVVDPCHATWRGNPLLSSGKQAAARRLSPPCSTSVTAGRPVHLVKISALITQPNNHHEPPATECIQVGVENVHNKLLSLWRPSGCRGASVRVVLWSCLDI